MSVKSKQHAGVETTALSIMEREVLHLRYELQLSNHRLAVLRQSRDRWFARWCLAERRVGAIELRVRILADVLHESYRGLHGIDAALASVHRVVSSGMERYAHIVRKHEAGSK
jgi:hypothetical protein